MNQDMHILKLHPTQVAIGLQAVKVKSKEITKMKRIDLEDFLMTHPVPVIRGPENRIYMIDHHHLCCALYRIGQSKVYVEEVEDLSDMTVDQFWSALADKKYLWMFDAQGEPLTIQQLRSILPSSIAGLRDDPYRSLAWFIRKNKAYNKVRVPFAEFKWANFLRHRVDHDDIEGAIALATTQDAVHLPGYIEK